MSKIKEGTKKVAEIIEAEQTRTNKELIIAAAVCTFVGIIIGFFIGKTTTSKNTVKKYNQCFHMILVMKKRKKRHRNDSNIKRWL